MSIQPENGQKMTISLKDRIQILTKSYSIITKNFSNWEAIIELEFDQIFDSAVEQSLITDSREKFSLIMKKLFASLKNGHSGYRDLVLEKENGYFDFEFGFYTDKWIITKSLNQELQKGTEITHINDVPIQKYYEANKDYICASSEYERKFKFGTNFNEYLFPLDLVLTLNNTKKVKIQRKEKQELKNTKSLLVEGKWLREQEIAYIKIPTFIDPDIFEKNAINLVNEYIRSNWIIIDIRDNDGGATPSDLLKKLMIKPFRSWSFSTKMTFGLFDYYSTEYKLKTKRDDPNYSKNVLEMADYEIFNTLNNGSFLLHSEYEFPVEQNYKGNIIILTSRITASASEDFVMPMKMYKRAIIIGEKTRGSTGEPFLHTHPLNIRMYASTKRTYFPNGDLFEGKGIEPDYEVVLTENDIKNGKDLVLEKAIEYIESK